MTLLATGCAGFIGSNFVRAWLAGGGESVINLDCLTYAGNAANLAAYANDPNYRFIKGSICDHDLVRRLLNEYHPRAIINFAAESHVDRSIHGAGDFIQSNMVGVFNLLEAARDYWNRIPEPDKSKFRFVHISTDEVYGTLGPADPAFRESSNYQPNSPYAASKAGGDHLVRAWYHTYGFPALTTNCSNNYGPYQFPEKLIPLVMLNAISGKHLPIYGDGMQIRDWLYVEDHCRAIARVLEAGRPGETYNIGGRTEKTNLEVVRLVCSLLDELRPRAGGKSYSEQITHVRDRPGHDRRYAIDAGKIARELGWQPRESFDTGLRKTIGWYLENTAWIENVMTGAYREWVETQYDNRPMLPDRKNS